MRAFVVRLLDCPAAQLCRNEVSWFHVHFNNWPKVGYTVEGIWIPGYLYFLSTRGGWVFWVFWTHVVYGFVGYVVLLIGFGARDGAPIIPL